MNMSSTHIVITLVRLLGRSYDEQNSNGEDLKIN